MNVVAAGDMLVANSVYIFDFFHLTIVNAHPRALQGVF